MKTIFIFIMGLVLLILIAFLFGFPTMWLWNWLMPSLFGLVKINLWKAIGINILCGILFKTTTNSDNKK